MKRTIPLALVLILGLLAWHFIRKPPTLQQAARVTEEEARPEPGRAPPEEPERIQPTAGPPIFGRVIDARQSPLSGIEVICGPDAARTAADGGFRFSPRSEAAEDVSIRRGGAEIARFGGVFVGAAGSTAGADPGMVSVRPERPPVMIRWTMNLGYAKAAAGEGGGTESPSFPGFAEPVAVLVEDWATTGLVRILSKSTLPDGAHLDCALYFDGERVVSSVERAEVKEGLFQSLIRFPEDLRVFSGTYQLRITFVADDEDPRDLERWARDRPDLPWTAMGAAEIAVDIYAGDPGEELAENRSVEAYYRETLGAIESLERMILSRGREAQGLAQGWDPQLLKDRAASAEAWFGDPLLDAAGRFDLKAWRRFLDEGFRPEVLMLLERHEAREAGKYRSAHSMLAEVLRRIILLSKIESVMVYQALGLKPDPKDRFLDSEGPLGDQTILKQILEKEMKNLNRMRTLTSQAPPGEQSK